MKRKVFALGEGVADADGPVVGDADHVARPGLVGDATVLRHEDDRAVDGDILAGAHLAQLHPALEVALNTGA